MASLRGFARAIISEDNVYTFRLWDWAFPGLFLPLRGRSWARYIPNILTYTRLVLCLPVLAWLAALELSPASQGAAAWAVLAALVFLRLTDILDGRAARDLDVVTDRGSKLDPLADGVLGFGMAIIAVLVVPRLIGPAVETSLIAIITVRLILDTAVMMARFRESRRGVIPVANKWGKLKYNLDFLLLMLLHLGILFYAQVPWALATVLAIGAVLTPLTLLLGWKNLQTHRTHRATA